MLRGESIWDEYELQERRDERLELTGDGARLYWALKWIYSDEPVILSGTAVSAWRAAVRSRERYLTARMFLDDPEYRRLTQEPLQRTERQP